MDISGIAGPVIKEMGNIKISIKKKKENLLTIFIDQI